MIPFTSLWELFRDFGKHCVAFLVVGLALTTIRSILHPYHTGGWNLTELGTLLTTSRTSSAFASWEACMSGPERACAFKPFKTWLLDSLAARQHQLRSALDVLGRHLPTALMSPGWIPAAQRLTHTLLQLLSAVRDAPRAALEVQFSRPPPGGESDSSSSGASSSSEDSDAAPPPGLGAPVAAVAAAAAGGRGLSRPAGRQRYVQLPAFSLAGLHRDLLAQISALPTTLNPSVPPPDSNKWKDVEPWLLKAARVILCTVSTTGSFLMRSAPAMDVCVIDEAAQLVEAEACIVLARFPTLKVLVLVGDHMQLPATVNSNLAKENGYGRSMFERFQVGGQLGQVRCFLAWLCFSAPFSKLKGPGCCADPPDIMSEQLSWASRSILA